MQGTKIVITRAPHQAEELSSQLIQRGAEVLLYPCIEIVPPGDCSELDSALQEMATGGFDWLILTSANAVLVLSQRLQILGLSPPASLALACVGPATAQAAHSLLGLRTRVLPQEYLAEALAAVLRPLLPARLLLLQAEKARPILREELVAAGATLRAVVCYRTVRGRGGIPLGNLLASRQVDAITFTSASTVQHCVARLQAEGVAPSRLADVCLACLGPLTARAAQDLGLPVHVQPAEHTLQGLVTALEAYFRAQHEEHTAHM